MVKNQKILNSKSRDIILGMEKIGGKYISLNEIQKETGISFQTLKNYIKILLEKEIVVIAEKEARKGKKTGSSTIRYSLNYKKIYN